jgi:beta-galactosidase
LWIRSHCEIACTPYLNGKLAGTLDRRLGENRLPLQVSECKVQLDILVENTRRVNFAKALREEREGITKPVLPSGKELSGWPAFYGGTFDVAEPGDTFLDMSSWSRGTVWGQRSSVGEVL